MPATIPSLRLRILGDPLLREPARDVDPRDPEIAGRIQAMSRLMTQERGLGLAGPQAGLPLRMIVLSPSSDGSGTPWALLNPRVVWRSEERTWGIEGCLSIPGVETEVERNERVTVEALDQAGEPVRIEADGLLARVLQHEIDHLDGVLMIDYMAPALRRSVERHFERADERGVAR